MDRLLRTASNAPGAGQGGRAGSPAPSPPSTSVTPHPPGRVCADAESPGPGDGGPQEGVEAGLRGLQASQELVGLILGRAEGLCRRLEGSSGLAERVSSRVRQLDTAQERVRGTLARLDALVDRANALQGLRTALDAVDYEEAARYVKVFRGSEVRGAAAGEDGQAEEVAMAAEVAKLEALVRVKLQEAEAAPDLAATVRFAALWAPLGKPAEGRAALGRFAAAQAAERGRAAWDRLLGTLDTPNAGFVAAMAEVVQGAAAVAQEVGAQAEAAFGPEGSAQVAAAVHGEAGPRCAAVVRRAADHRALARLMRDLGGAKGAGGDPIDTRRLEGVLEEILVLAVRCEEVSFPLPP